MRFTVRKEETQAIVDILESDDYASADDMAAALIHAVVDVLWFRDWYILAASVDGQTIAYGPFASEAEARAAGTKWQGALVPLDPKKWGVVPVRGLGGTVDERKGGGFGFCTTDGCGHPAYAHSMAGTARGYCVICKNSKGLCDKYEQAKAKPKPRAKKKESA